MVRGLLAILNFYQKAVSPHLGARCRYIPRCSDYAKDALRQHGFWRGAAAAMKRILRCQPLGGSGFDPV